MNAVILSGGFGTRLYPLTLKRPKSIMDFLDRPLVDYQLDLVEQARCQCAVMALGHLSTAVESICRQYDGNASISFATEEEPLGTGGALANALRQCPPGNPVLVLNGDVICDLSPRSLQDAHQRADSLATIVAAPVKDPGAYGSLVIDEQGKVNAFKEKVVSSEAGNLTPINAGIYLLSSGHCDELRDSSGAFSLERDIFPRLAAEGRIAAHVHQGFWRDVGTLESYFNTHFDLLSYFLMMGTANFGGRRNNYTLFRDLIYINNSVRLGDKCDLYHRVVLMDNVKVGSNCYLRNCILLPGAEIGDNCRLETVIIDRDTIVSPDSDIAGEVISGDRHEPFGG